MTVRPPHDIVRAVRTELATPGRYHLHPRALSAQPSWLELAFRWVSHAYGRFEQALAARLHIGGEASGIIGDVLVVASVFTVAFVAARLLVTIQLERGTLESHPLIATRSAQALSRAAAEAAAGGDYAHAVRLLFAASVVMLDLRGVVADDESATINELRRMLRARASAAEPPFAEIARAYTAAAYAQRGIDADAWLRAQAAYARLAELAA